MLLQLRAPHHPKPPLRVPALSRGLRNALDSRCIGLRLGQEVARRQLSGECQHDGTTGTFRREWSGVSVLLDVREETAELRWK